LSKDEYIELQTHIWYLQHNDAAMVKLGQQCKPAQVQQPWTCYRIGQGYQNLGLAQAALAWYQQAVNLAPSNLDFINKLGTILIQLDETAKGIDYLKRSLNLYPQQPDALTNIGFGYLKQNNSAAAMNAYNQALAIDPDYEQALLNKAALLNLQGNPTEAKKVLRQLLKRNPNHPQVNLLLQQL
jgi:tetratricopeptide (TPR) repeat protein